MDVDKKDLIENEILRMEIQHHPNFRAWHGMLPPHARQVFDRLVKEDISLELIEMALAAPENEWEAVMFLRVIGGGNTNPEIALALTNVTLGEIMYQIESMA